MVSFIDEHRDAHEVLSICKVLPIAPSSVSCRNPQLSPMFSAIRRIAAEGTSP